MANRRDFFKQCVVALGALAVKPLFGLLPAVPKERDARLEIDHLMKKLRNLGPLSEEHFPPVVGSTVRIRIPQRYIVRDEFARREAENG